jgi:hypothetical protein
LFKFLFYIIRFLLVLFLLNYLRFNRSLTPGGFIEVVDICFPLETDDNSVPADSALRKWAALVLESTAKLGARMDSAKSYKTQLEAAGFIGVVEVKYKWPQNHWPKNQKYKEIGMCDSMPNSKLLGISDLGLDTVLQLGNQPIKI